VTKRLKRAAVAAALIAVFPAGAGASSGPPEKLVLERTAFGPYTRFTEDIAERTALFYAGVGDVRDCPYLRSRRAMCRVVDRYVIVDEDGQSWRIRETWKVYLCLRRDGTAVLCATTKGMPK
jgi:hypothetical protein